MSTSKCRLFILKQTARYQRTAKKHMSFQNPSIRLEPTPTTSILTSAVFFALDHLQEVDPHQHELWITLPTTSSYTIAKMLAFSKTIASATIVPRLAAYHVIDFEKLFYDILFTFFSSTTLKFSRGLRLRVETEMNMSFLENKVFSETAFWRSGSLQRLSLMLGFEGAYRSFLNTKQKTSDVDGDEKDNSCSTITYNKPEDWEIWNQKLPFLEEIEIGSLSPRTSLGLHSKFVSDSLRNAEDPAVDGKRLAKLLLRVLTCSGSISTIRMNRLFLADSQSKRQFHDKIVPLVLDEENFFSVFRSVSNNKLMVFPSVETLDLRNNNISVKSKSAQGQEEQEQQVPISSNIISRLADMFPNLLHLLFHDMNNMNAAVDSSGVSIPPVIDDMEVMQKFRKLEFFQLGQSSFQGVLDLSSTSCFEYMPRMKRIELGGCSQLTIHLNIECLPDTLEYFVASYVSIVCLITPPLDKNKDSSSKFEIPFDLSHCRNLKEFIISTSALKIPHQSESSSSSRPIILLDLSKNLPKSLEVLSVSFTHRVRGSFMFSTPNSAPFEFRLDFGDGGDDDPDSFRNLDNLRDLWIDLDSTMRYEFGKSTSPYEMSLKEFFKKYLPQKSLERFKLGCILRADDRFEALKNMFNRWRDEFKPTKGKKLSYFKMS